MQIKPSNRPSIGLQVKQKKKLDINNFLLLGKLGEGSYSEVYKAIDKETGFVIALKILSKAQIRE